MAGSRKRNFGPLITLAVLLLATYIGSFAALPWFVGRGMIDRANVEGVMSVTHAPLIAYQRSGGPGAAYLSNVQVRWYAIGSEQRRLETLRDD